MLLLLLLYEGLLDCLDEPWMSLVLGSEIDVADELWLLAEHRFLASDKYAASALYPVNNTLDCTVSVHRR